MSGSADEIKGAIGETLNSKEFGSDVAKLCSLGVKLAEPGVTGFDVAKFAVEAIDIAVKLGGVAENIGPAIPMIGAMIGAMEAGQTMVLAWQKDQLHQKAARFDLHDWAINPSGEGGALSAADLPEAFDVLLLTFGAGRTTGYGFVGGGHTLSSGAMHRQQAAQPDNAANPHYIHHYRDIGLALSGVMSTPATVELQYGGSVASQMTPPKPTALESYLLRLGKLRRAQRLKSEKVARGILFYQMAAAYGYALKLSHIPSLDCTSWEHETAYMARRASLACWLDSPLNSEPDGYRLRYTLLIGNVRSVTNARYGAGKAAKR